MRFNSKAEFAIFLAQNEGNKFTCESFNKHEYLTFDNNYHMPYRYVCASNIPMDYTWATYSEDWVEYKKPIPDKALVWAWDDAKTFRLLCIYDTINDCIFTHDGKRIGVEFENYEIHEGKNLNGI